MATQKPIEIPAEYAAFVHEFEKLLSRYPGYAERFQLVGDLEDASGPQPRKITVTWECKEWPPDPFPECAPVTDIE